MLVIPLKKHWVVILLRAIPWKISRAFGSYEAMLNDPDIDAVYISLPNHLHKEWSIKAMRMDKHVLCEKPMALSASDVDKMAATVKETNRVLTETFMTPLYII
ncbi:MAG: hypothetical protein Kow002_17170 [Anaerolineales bacterium]